MSTKSTSWARVAASAAGAALLLAPNAVATTGATAPQPEDAGKFVPWVTDFGREPRPAGPPVVIGSPVPAPAVPVTVDARRWSDVALGTGLGFALAGALAGLAVAAHGVRGRRGIEAPPAEAAR